jgi:hypothetical protein
VCRSAVSSDSGCLVLMEECWTAHTHFATSHSRRGLEGSRQRPHVSRMADGQGIDAKAGARTDPRGPKRERRLFAFCQRATLRRKAAPCGISTVRPSTSSTTPGCVSIQAEPRVGLTDFKRTQRYLVAQPGRGLFRRARKAVAERSGLPVQESSTRPSRRLHAEPESQSDTVCVDHASRRHQQEPSPNA